jgi:hypothetical protein
MGRFVACGMPHGTAPQTRSLRRAIGTLSRSLRDTLPHAQNSVTIPPGARTLLPGDQLITTCTYDSSSRTNVTIYGLGSRDEMCFK